MTLQNPPAPLSQTPAHGLLPNVATGLTDQGPPPDRGRPRPQRLRQHPGNVRLRLALLRGVIPGPAAYHPCRRHRNWQPFISWNWPKNANSRWPPSGCTRLRPPGEIFLELHPRKLPPQANLVLLPARRVVQHGAGVGEDVLRTDVPVPVMLPELSQSPLSVMLLPHLDASKAEVDYTRYRVSSHRT